MFGPPESRLLFASLASIIHQLLFALKQASADVAVGLESVEIYLVRVSAANVDSHSPATLSGKIQVQLASQSRDGKMHPIDAEKTSS